MDSKERTKQVNLEEIERESLDNSVERFRQIQRDISNSYHEKVYRD